MQLHARLGITQQPDDGDVVLSSDDESEIGAPPQEEEKEEEEEAPVLVERSEHARAHEKGTVPSPKGAPAKRVHHSRHMLSQALADAVADRGAYPLGAHVRDALAPTGRRFVPWSATVTGPQVPPMALAADDAPWTELWASDPKAVGRLRPLTHAVGRSLAQTAAQHKTVLSDTAREYGERKIKASICGPHSREGDREGGEGLAGKGHKRQRLEDLGSKKRYATSIKSRGAPARALTKTELYAQPRPATKKHLIPTDGMDGGKLAGVISALAPAALALTKRFMVELPVHAALQWLTARVGHARFGPFVTEPLGAWSNLALFFAEPQDGAPARQKPLAAHTDRLNAQFRKPRWIEGRPPSPSGWMRWPSSAP